MRFHESGPSSSSPAGQENRPSLLLAADDPHQACLQRHKQARGMLFHQPVSLYCSCVVFECTGPCCADPRESKPQ